MIALGVLVHDLALRFYGDPRPLARLRKLIASSAFQLVHAHLPPAELYARLALLGISAKALPLVISKHNDCPFHALPGELLMERWVARRASTMIVISDAVRRYMTTRRVGLAPCRMETIRYGIDPTPYEQVSPQSVADLRLTWGANPNTLLVGFVGRIVPQKSLETLIGAFALFMRGTPCDAKLVIVGEGPLRSQLRECATANGVTERVVWAGFREDIPAVMGAFDIFALTSNFEGFGLVLAEAMAARRPVVATRVSAIPEVVLDRETGLLAEPGSAESVAHALTQLLNPTTRARFGAAGHERVRQNFTLERMFAATDAVYEHALQPMALRQLAPETCTAPFAA